VTCHAKLVAQSGYLHFHSEHHVANCELQEGTTMQSSYCCAHVAVAVAVAGRLQAPVHWLTVSTLHARCVTDTCGAAATHERAAMRFVFEPLTAVHCQQL
jgi:hypothetical protein